MSNSPKATRPSGTLHASSCVVSLDLYGLFAQILLRDYQWGAGSVEYATLVAPSNLPNAIRTEAQIQLTFVSQESAEDYPQNKSWCLLIGCADSLQSATKWFGKTQALNADVHYYALSIDLPGDPSSQRTVDGVSSLVQRHSLDVAQIGFVAIQTVKWQFDLRFLPVSASLMRRNTGKLVSAAASIKACIAPLDEYQPYEQRVLTCLASVAAESPWSFAQILDSIEIALLLGVCLFGREIDTRQIWEQSQLAYEELQADCSDDRDLTELVNEYCDEREWAAPSLLFHELEATEIDLPVELGLMQLAHARHCQAVEEIEMAISSAVIAKRYAEYLIGPGDLSAVTADVASTEFIDFGKRLIPDDEVHDYLQRRYEYRQQKKLQGPSNTGEHLVKSRFRNELFDLLKDKGDARRRWKSQAEAIVDIWNDAVHLLKKYNLMVGRSDSQLVTFLKNQMERHLPGDVRTSFFQRSGKTR